MSKLDFEFGYEFVVGFDCDCDANSGAHGPGFNPDPVVLISSNELS